MYTLSNCFDATLEHVKIDAALAKKIYIYRGGIIAHHKEHMEFFGGNLLGTHRIYFKDAFYTEFFEGILNVPYDTVRHDLLKVTTINHDFIISSDPMNNTLMYLIHRFMRATHLDEKKRYNAALDLAMIFFYRCFCIIISDQFDFVANPKVANQAYANLSMKFLIKKLGTWNKVVEYRAKALVDKKESIHYRSLYSYDDDQDIVYAINDSQGRIKGIIKEYYSELMSVAEGGGEIGVAKALVKDQEGDNSLREKGKGAEHYIIYVRSILLDKHSFVRDEILEVVSRSNTNTSKRSTRDVLEWMSEASMEAKVFTEVDYFISKCLTLCSHYIETQIPTNRKKDLVFVAKTIKDLFLSTRSTDPDLLEVRDKGAKIIKKVLGKTSDSLIKATRTAVFVYISLLAIAGSRT